MLDSYVRFSIQSLFKDWVLESSLNFSKHIVSYYIDSSLSHLNLIDKILRKQPKESHTMVIVTSKPGVIIGPKGELFKKYKEKILSKNEIKDIKIIEVDEIY
jgi:ribosomal protein S3